MLHKTNKIITDNKYLNIESLYQNDGFKKVTNNVEVTAWPEYDSQSNELLSDVNIWNYTIKISNHNQRVIKLKSRYFRIVDENGEIKEVIGDGVVGKQPEILPNDFFEYQSSVNLKSDSAIMLGHYVVEFIGGEEFKIDIPAFSLDIPANDYIVN